VTTRSIILVTAVLTGSASNALAQSDCDTNKPILVHVAKDGSIVWEATPMTRLEAIRRFSQLAKGKPMPNIQIVPDRMSKFDVVASILADVQKTGFYCLGFTGTDSGR
jgi:biopolymer transport protein ExbD